ncbi:hypothetical protein FNO01nite_34160 [Flavobacterium noncentrifugens]|uniref:RES domain-containing protein n=1 Tax=Flavobacterium noncentrifugens TaxID=1128970 RepID=A0A1G8XQV1_9FLAO|nr:hypothetical protein [Flavobacterium noncentrifugens]GEP52744.1 hypothetical protein FNO01nite_34160 [Flavobacterium noncentrifugens]SDJ92847.1 hypothetical protein SAMN04487935_2024 [Flavobacterium noncentrifugens]
MNPVNYKNLEETELSISRLKKVVWPDINSAIDHNKFIKDVEQILFNEFDYIPLSVRINDRFDLPLFRARELKSFTDINLFHEHSLPPIHLSVTQRCNFAGHPVFYCSMNPLTAVFEVVRNNDYTSKKYCISKWAISEGSEIANQSFLQVPLHKENYLQNLRNDEKEKVRKIFGRELEESKVNGIIKYWEFLQEMFVSDNYTLSATLAHKSLFGKNNPINPDIIIYPSLQSNSVTANFAIHPNFVNQRLILKRLYVVEIVGYNKTSMRCDVNVTKFGKIERNKIIWEDPITEGYLEAYAQDFKHMVE